MEIGSLASRRKAEASVLRNYREFGVPFPDPDSAWRHNARVFYKVRRAVANRIITARVAAFRAALKLPPAEYWTDERPEVLMQRIVAFVGEPENHAAAFALFGWKVHTGHKLPQESKTRRVRRK